MVVINVNKRMLDAICREVSEGSFNGSVLSLTCRFENVEDEPHLGAGFDPFLVRHVLHCGDNGICESRFVPFPRLRRRAGTKQVVSVCLEEACVANHSFGAAQPALVTDDALPHTDDHLMSESVVSL